MQEFKVYAPTYYGNSAEHKGGKKREFDDPRVPILARPADGMRIVLGTHDYFDGQAPDIQIERRPNGWAIFLHPLGGSDACGYVYFIDDGRSFIVAENGLGPTAPIEPLRSVENVPDIDNLNARK